MKKLSARARYPLRAQSLVIRPLFVIQVPALLVAALRRFPTVGRGGAAVHTLRRMGWGGGLMAVLSRRALLSRRSGRRGGRSVLGW